MLTRQGRKSPQNEEDDESGKLDTILQDAGMLEANMTLEDKRDIYRVLQESKVAQVEKETHKLASSSPHSPQTPSESIPSSSRDQDKTPKSSESATERKYADDIITEDIAETSTPQEEDQQQEPLPIPTVQKEEQLRDDRRPGSAAGSVRKVGRGVGRGRAVPTKGTKYPPLPGVSQKPQKPLSFHSSTPQNQPTSPPHKSLTSDARSIASSSQDPPQSPVLDRFSQQIGFSSSPTSPETGDLPRPCNPTPDSTKNQQVTVSNVDEADEGEDDHVDVLSDDSTSETKQGVLSSNHNMKVESPVPVKDAEEDNGGGGDDVLTEPVLTTQMGNLTVSVSPFEIMLKPMSSMSVPPIFKELDQLRANDTEWVAQAKEVIKKHKNAYWEKLLAESPWVTIRDGGINKRTLYKEETPKYSRFFGGSTEKQVAAPVLLERQSKTRAMTKMQESLSDSWPEPEFHSLRRSKQKEMKREDQTGSKQGSACNTTTRSDPDDDDEVQCLEDAAGGSGNVWQSSRLDQKRKPTDSDPDISAEGGGSRDVFDFEDDEIWTPAANKNKKNNKRSGKSYQDDVEVEGRPSQRGRGLGGPPQYSRGRNTKLRLAKGTIARPSEHATCSNISRNKGGPPEHFEEDTNARNNADSEDRVWANQTETDNSNDIAPAKFYNPKVIHPRNTPPSQSRRNSRENRRSNDFPTSPGSSGGVLGRLHDEVAVIETVPCPICCKNFPKTEIEEHAGQCFNFSVGEEPDKGSQDSEDSDQTVAEGRKKTDQNECSNCNEHFTVDELTVHMKDCFKNVPSSSGNKRANSMEVDDGPAKKTSRLLD